MPFKKLFVTGGNGFIGSSLVAHLNSQGYQVSCLVRDHKRGNRLYGSSVRLYIGSLGYISSVELEKMIEGHDAVLHLASISREQMIPWEEYVRTNVNGAEDILRASLSCGVRKLLYFSTVGVLGTTPRRLPGMEDAPYDPDCSYHRSKAFAERKVLEWDRRGLNTTIIRPTITYGPAIEISCSKWQDLSTGCVSSDRLRREQDTHRLYSRACRSDNQCIKHDQDTKKDIHDSGQESCPAERAHTHDLELSRAQDPIHTDSFENTLTYGESI